MSPLKTMTLESLAHDGLEEDFERAMKQVLENIADLNTDAKKARKLKIELTFKPVDEGRGDLKVTEKVTTVLAGPREHTRVAMADRDGLYMNSSGADPRQRDAFEDLEKPDIAPTGTEND